MTTAKDKIFIVRFLGSRVKVKPVALVVDRDSSGREYLQVKCKYMGKDPKVRRITGGTIRIPVRESNGGLVYRLMVR